MSVSSIIASAAPKKFVPEIPLPLTGPEQTSSKYAKGEKSKVAFGSCQNCTINVNIQYAGPSTKLASVYARETSNIVATVCIASNNSNLYFVV